LSSEKWHERRSKNAAEQKFVDNVRGVIGGVVCIRQSGLPDHYAEHNDANYASDATDGRAGGDRKVGSQQTRSGSGRCHEGQSYCDLCGRCA